MFRALLRVIILVAVALFILQFIPVTIRGHAEEIMMALEIHRLFLNQG